MKKQIRVQIKEKIQKYIKLHNDSIKSNKKKMILKQQAVMSGVLVILLIALVLTYNTKAAEEKKARQAAETEQSVNSGEVSKATEEEAVVEPETLEERLKRVKKQAKQDGYPKDIIELLSKNSETIDFVEDFGEKKDQPIAESVSDELVKGEIPQILQWDERWGYAPYGTGFVSTCGCGPTALSMVVSGLTGDSSVTPAVVAAYSEKKGYIDKENNTYWDLMKKGAEHWGLTSSEGDKSEEKVAKALKKGHPIICSMGPGDFTKIGHFIVLTRYEKGKVKVNDPFSQQNSDRLWSYKEIKDQIKALWVYSLDE